MTRFNLFIVLRPLLLILMYTGVLLFLYPYVAGRISLAIPFLIFGALLAVSAGLLRCYLTEGDCSERVLSRHNP